MGTIYQTVKFVNIDISKPSLVELCPLGETPSNCNFILDRDFLENTPKNLAVTDLKGGYLLHFSGGNISQDFSVLCQEKKQNISATVFNENGLKISIDNQNDFFLDSFPFLSNTAKINFFESSNNKFVSVTFSDFNNATAIYHLGETIKKIFFDTDLELIPDYPIKTIKRYKDIAKHVVEKRWELKDKTLVCADSKIEVSKDFCVDNLKDELIPYAFLESYLVGEDFKSFLSDNVQKNYHKISSYLKNFIGIMPPPVFRNENEIGLIYKTKENFYEVLYITFDIENRKITNLKLCDK